MTDLKAALALLHRVHRLHETKRAGVTQSVEALQQRAAADPDAAFELALRFGLGIGVAAWPARAVHWYQHAAEAGHVGAMFAISVCYLYGFGGPRNLAESAKWMARCTASIDPGNAQRKRARPADINPAGGSGQRAALRSAGSSSRSSAREKYA